MHHDEDEGSLIPLFLSLGATLAASTEAVLRSATHTLDLESSESIVRRWRRRIFRAGEHTVDVEGRELVEHGRAYLVMSNHRSLLDIPAILASFPLPVRTVSPVLTRLGFVKRLDDARARLQQGISMWVSPEGRRSRDGVLRDFRVDAFRLAMDTGVPIVPVWIEGTERIRQTGTFRLRSKRHVEVKIGPPIDTADVDDINVLVARVRTAILALSPLTGAWPAATTPATTTTTTTSRAAA